MKMFLFWAISFVMLVAVYAQNKSPSCSGLLKSSTTPGINVITAEEFSIGSLNVSGTLSPVVNTIPFCRLQGIIKYKAGGNDNPDPSGNDTLIWELYLPNPSQYNGRFLAVGDGGFGGTIDESTMMSNLNKGYAVAGCDSGHSLADSGDNTPFAPYLLDSAKVRAWIHNSIAMTTSITRSLTIEYYSSNPKFSYYYGCSTGGAQGYALAQYHPDLFDGIYAGSPGNWYSHLILSFLWNGLHTQGNASMSQDTLNFITNSVVDACDGIDGVLDKLIENPPKCSFNVATLACRPGQNPITNNATVCLTADQLQAVQAIYKGPRNVNTGEQIYPGLSLGSENGWLGQELLLYTIYAAPILRELVFKNLTYDISSFNWGSDVDVVDRIASPLIDERSPDLFSYFGSGRKLITTQGWADQYNAATWPIEHLQQIQSAFHNEDISDFIRVFMVPGGGHCGENPEYPHVPGTYEVLDALVPWVEKGIAPSQMLSSGPPDGSNTTRKLCPWPANAKFVGGDISNWNSYICI